MQFKLKRPTTSYVNATNNEMGAWFPKDKGWGGCLTLSHFGEKACVKRKHPKMYAHSLMHSRFHLPSRFGEREMFWSSILHVFSFFPRFACQVHHLALIEMLWSILIILYSIMCMCNVHSSCLQNNVLFWVVHRWYPWCCCAMVSSVTEWVEAWFVVLTLWSIVCAYFFLVWTGFEWNWI